MQDTQAHLNQMHADMKETHDELKTRHDAFAASSHQWHQSFIAALKDANSKTGQQGGSSVATGTHGITAGTNAGTTVTGVNGTTGTVRTAADTGANGAATGSVTASGDQTAASTGALGAAIGFLPALASSEGAPLFASIVIASVLALSSALTQPCSC